MSRIKNIITCRVRILYGLVLMALCFTASAMASEPLTLETCLQSAFEKNPELSQARKSHDESVLRIEQAQARFFPVLDADAKAGYASEISSMVFGPMSIQTSEGMPVATIPAQEVEIGEHSQMNFSLSLKQPLYMGGRITNAVEAYKANAAVANDQITETQNRIRFDVTRAFFQLAKASELKKVALSVRELTGEHLKDAKNLVAQGMLLKSDLLPVELKRLQAELDIVQAENTELRAKAFLAERIGMPADDVLEIQVAWDDTPPWPIPDDLSPEQFTRPEQKIVRKNLEIAEIGVELATGEKRPEVSLLLASNYSWPGFVNGDPEWTPWWQAGVNVSWNLFDMGARSKKKQEAHLKCKRIKDAVQEVDRKIELDRVNTRLAYVESHSKLLIAKEKVVMATENYRKVRDNFKEGIASNTDYLDAQTELANARNGEAIMAAELRIAWADYLRALGKTKNIKE